MLAIVTALCIPTNRVPSLRVFLQNLCRATTVCCAVLASIYAGQAAAAGQPAQVDNADILLLTAGLRTISLTPSVQTVIGPGGGTVTSARATLVVPAGALGNASYVSLEGIRPDVQFGSNSARSGYKVIFRSPTLAKDATLAIAGFGGPDRTVLVAMYDTAGDYEGNTNSTQPNLVEGQVVSGTLRVTIPAVELDATTSGAGSNANAVNTWREFGLWAVAGYSILRSAHFRLTYPTALAGQTDDYPQLILDYAEAAYARLNSMGYAFTDGLNWPHNINLEYNLGAANGYASIPLSGKRNTFSVIAASLCAHDKLDLLKATVGHEFFHAVQNVYDPRSGIRIRHEWATPYFLWLSEASSTWFEGRFLDSSSYVPNIFLGNYDMMQQGLETYADHAGAQNTGYWASGFLRYLTGIRGDVVVRQAWEEVSAMGTGSSQYSDLTALGRGVNTISSLAVSWQVYIDKFITGQTGYAGWKPPDSSLTWYNSSLVSDVETILYRTLSSQLTPFSAFKWTLIFRKDLIDSDYVLELVDAPADVEFTLFKGPGLAGPFAKVATLAADAPYIFTAEVGSAYLVSVVGTNTDAPYRTPAVASARIGLTGASTLCPEAVPEGVHPWIMLSSDGKSRLVTKDYVFYADEVYYDAERTQPGVVNCGKPDGGCDFKKEWYENGVVRAVTPMNAACQKNGLQRIYYESGLIDREANYLSDLLNGAYAEYYDGGGAKIQGAYAAGLRNGTWTWYDQSGAWTMVCQYSAGQELSCRSPGDP